MVLEDIFLSESQSHKTHIIGCYLCEMTRIGNSKENQIRAYQGWVGQLGKTQEVTAQGDMDSFGVGDNVLRYIVMAAQLCEYTESHFLYTLYVWHLNYITM